MPPHLDASIRIQFQEEAKHGARIKVVGVGGGGINAVNRMIEAGVDGVEFISVNTDLQSLQNSRASVRLQLGARLTRGLGTGANPEVGRRAALEDSDKIIEAIEDADMVFVTAGLGGGTGTGAAPVIASLASQMGALTLAIVTRPFSFEGKRRMNQAERGVQELLDHADTLIVIPNEKLLAAAKDAGFFDSFQIADDVLRQAVQGISDIITIRGVINRDFADVRTTMAGMGYAVMGTATCMGANRAATAALAAITSPLLEAGAIDGARGILINITGSSTLKLTEVSEASTIIHNAAHEDASIIFGAVLDERLGDEVKITVIATGFRQESRKSVERGVAMLNQAEQPTIYYEESSQRGIYTPIQPHVATSPERVTSEGHLVESGADRVVGADLWFGPQNASTSKESMEMVEQPHVESFATAALPPSENPPNEKASNEPELYFTNEWFEDDLLEKIEGPAFDLDPATEDPVAVRQQEPLAQPEARRLRQTALAAYAATSATEGTDEEPVPPEAATFAEILASRKRIFGPISTDAILSELQTTDAGADVMLIHNSFDAPIFKGSTARPVEPPAVPAFDRSTGPERGLIADLNTHGLGLRRSLPGYSEDVAEPSNEPGELDIPAFLRRRT